MAIDGTSRWRPDWAVPPGEILLETLQERGITQSELARRTARPIKTINEIVRGKAALTPDTALQLELALGIPARFWSNLELAYREYLARTRIEQELQENLGWAKLFPLADLWRRRVLPRPANDPERVAQLLAFFGVSSRAAWEKTWREGAVAYRSSPSFKSAPEAVFTWLRWGELEAQAIDVSPFSHAGLKKALEEMRPLLRKLLIFPVLRQIRAICARAGVAFVLIPEVQGTRLSGAVRWIASDRVVLQLSLRHKTDDQFWFSLLHEAGHLLKPNGKQDFIDDANHRHLDDQERRADAFARNWLVDPDVYARFAEERNFSKTVVSQFAEEVGVAPGIIVGRLQYDRLIVRSSLNDLKRRVRFVGDIVR